MEGFFIILIVIPIITIVSLFIAIYWGFTKSKNPKKYFITLTCVVVAIAFFLSSAFYDYKSIIVNTFSFTKVPSQYKEYLYLNDTVTTKYTIKALDGSISEIFTDSLTHNLIITTKAWDEYFCYRIDSLGHLIDSLNCPENMYQRGRYLLGTEAYSDWITTGDTTHKAYNTIDGVLTRKTFAPLYYEADYVEFFWNNICVLHKDDGWYSCKLDFSTQDYSDNEPYKNKQDFANIHLAAKSADLPSMNPSDYYESTFYDGLLIFKECPASKANGILSFDYFRKINYNSGFSSLFSGIGSPTGGNHHSEKWDGVAYCKLKIGDRYVPFAYKMEHTLGHWDEYIMRMSIYINPNYAIFGGEYWTYIMIVNN